LENNDDEHACLCDERSEEEDRRRRRRRIGGVKSQKYYKVGMYNVISAKLVQHDAHMMHTCVYRAIRGEI